MQSSVENPNKLFGIHRGYIIVAACFLIMTVAYGAQNSFGVFFKPMSGDFGWTRAATSGAVALYMVINGLLSIISGKLSDRFGPKLVVSLGAVILGIGYMLMYRLNSLWELYLCYGVLVAAGSSALYVPLVSMVARWFPHRRGLMSGVGIAGIGFGIGVVPWIASHMIERYSWRIPLLAVGIVCIIAIVALAQTLQNAPESTNVSESKKAGKAPAAAAERGFTFREAARTKQFWMIFVAWVLYGYFFQVGVVHIVPYASDLGMAAVAAATVLTTIGFIGTLGRISLGFIGDKFGNRRTVLISYAVMGIAFFGLSFVHSLGMLYVFAVIFGFLFGIGILLIPTIAEYFGFKELGIISGTMVCSNALGGAIGPPVAGAIFDSTGSYQLAFISCGILGLAASALIFALKPTRENAVATEKVTNPE